VVSNDFGMQIYLVCMCYNQKYSRHFINMIDYGNTKININFVSKMAQ